MAEFSRAASKEEKFIIIGGRNRQKGARTDRRRGAGLEPSYLASVSRTIYDVMAQADPKAIWLQMAWTFYCDKEY